MIATSNPTHEARLHPLTRMQRAYGYKVAKRATHLYRTKYRNSGLSRGEAYEAARIEALRQLGPMPTSLPARAA